MDTASFLKTVVTSKEGFFNLALREPESEDWIQVWYSWPQDINKIVEHALSVAHNTNVYFSAHLFEVKQATKNNVLPSRTIQADLDNAIIPTVNAPSILVETSPNRHQGFWILKDPHDPVELEDISKQLTYSIVDSDHSGWSLGHKMRVPGTFNHKYSGSPRAVTVISAVINQYSNLKLGPRARKLLEQLKEEDEEWKPATLDVGPRELWVSIKPSLPRKVQSQYDVRQQDRSSALFSLECALFRSGLNRDQVFIIAEASANNKFKDNRYHGSIDLAKDVIRAERAVTTGTDEVEDIRTKVMEARKLPGPTNEKRQYIASLVREHLSQHGSFVATSDGQEWYVREDTGRPITLTRSNDYLNSLLEIKYGLNATEPEQRYVLNSLISTTKERGRSGETAALSHYDKSQNLLLLHTGRKDVLHINPTGISSIVNGNLNIVFPWKNNEDPFDPDTDNPLSIDTLFSGCFDNLNEMLPAEALALMKAWFYFIFFRDDAIGRPILALLGQPGSGKTSLFHRIYRLLYGTTKTVNSPTTADNFDHAVSIDPLVALDQVDGYINWLPDKLALSAAKSDLIKRKLYTDSDSITLKRQALVGITAHNPKFGREDVIDRMLMINFHRLAKFLPETFLEQITNNRDRLWGGIVKDIQKILAMEQPSNDELPHFRVNDFSRIGLWIARALDFEQDFVSGLSRNIHEQTSFNLEEEDILIDTIKLWISRSKHDSTKFWSVGELWTQWSAISRDPQNFVKQYKNAVILGKKLWSLQDTLESVIEAEAGFGPTGTRVWRFAKK